MLKKFFAVIAFFSIYIPFTLASQTLDPEQLKLEKIFSQAIEGPSQIKLKDQATFNLPANMIYLPKKAANDYMELIGNGVIQQRLGLIMPTDENSEWLADILFENVGYVSDEDAKNWDIDELYNSLDEGNKHQNKIRREKGISELELQGWIEKPNYNPQTQHLVWSVVGKEVGNNANENNIVNYNTYILGREGYIELNFITEQQLIKTEKLIAQNLLNQIKFNSGKQYSDYNAATDKTTEYGLAALIGGAAVAKKLGLFAVIGAFLAKFWKIIAIAIFAIFPLARKFLNRKKIELGNEPKEKENKENKKGNLVE